VETIGASLDDVERCDPVLHFIDERHAEAAVNAAERLDRASDPGGPLAGLPFLIMARTPPRVPIVARLVAADAIPIGTSSRHGRTGSR
jgi:Asp-tRNA(Asn)/Glu-tRNA(Gln) amidotransferase A subunit family amidase